MAESSGPRVRYSVQYLQDEYNKGNKKPLEDLVRAWKGIQELPPTDERSFFVLGGYHGEPFQYRKQVDELPEVDQYQYWGGYCNHGNVLFPTWHRIYVLKLEEALRSIVPDVTMPYWDETSDDALAHGIPAILTQETFELDGKTIPNPLCSFTLPKGLSDDLPGDQSDYVKPSGYTTVRYPLSGLVGTPAMRAATKLHNAQYENAQKNTELLNQNIIAWLYGEAPSPQNPNPQGPGIYWEYQNCLNAPNYTVFSNTTSASAWNTSNNGNVTPLEQPHNDIHLAVGGFDLPNQQEFGQIAGSNGDMGENNTAAMDPIFFFHHCNVDRMFWLWQKKNGFMDTFDIISDTYPGTNSYDLQGPTPEIAPGASLSLDTPLNPFKKDDSGTMYTSRDCFNIETQLGYTYAPGSFDTPSNLQQTQVQKSDSGLATKKLIARGIDRALFQGSFVLTAYATTTTPDGHSTKRPLGYYSVLSRWSVVKCANCLNHLEVIAHFPLPKAQADAAAVVEYSVEVTHREIDTQPSTGLRLNTVTLLESNAAPAAKASKFNCLLEIKD